MFTLNLLFLVRVMVFIILYSYSTLDFTAVRCYYGTYTALDLALDTRTSRLSVGTILPLPLESTNLRTCLVRSTKPLYFQRAASPAPEGRGPIFQCDIHAFHCFSRCIVELPKVSRRLARRVFRRNGGVVEGLEVSSC